MTGGLFLITSKLKYPIKQNIREATPECNTVISSTILLLMSPLHLRLSGINNYSPSNSRMDYEIFCLEMPIKNGQL